MAVPFETVLMCCGLRQRLCHCLHLVYTLQEFVSVLRDVRCLACARARARAFVCVASCLCVHVNVCHVRGYTRMGEWVARHWYVCLRTCPSVQVLLREDRFDKQV